MKRNRGKLSVRVLFLLIALVAASSGQEIQKRVVELRVAPLHLVGTAKLNSKLMGREMPYRISVPDSYGNDKEKRYPVIVLLHGLTGHFDNWFARTKLAEYAMNHQFIIVTPEGNDGWYTDSVSMPTDKYESYIIQELIPEIDKNYRTLANRKNRAIAGLSMGGYGSLKFGLKYPEMFSLAGSFSGALGAASFSEKTAGPIGKAIDLIYGPLDSDTRKANDLFRIVKDLSPEKLKSLPFLYVDCGTEDFLIQNNRDFMQLLVEKKVPHEFRQLPGAHNWEYWDSQVQEFLRVADRTVSGK
jgi:putative tributyrin esterase